MFDKLDEVIVQFDTLTEKLADPSIYDRQDEFKKISSDKLISKNLLVFIKNTRF